MELKSAFTIKFQTMLCNAVRTVGGFLILSGLLVLGAQALNWLKKGVWLSSSPRIEPELSDLVAWVDAQSWVGLRSILEGALDLPTSGYLIVGGLLIFAVAENFEAG